MASQYTKKLSRLRYCCQTLICIALIPVFNPPWTLLRLILCFFMIDYEKAIIGRYWRPVIGLHLCRRCAAIRYRLRDSGIRHYDDYRELKASADRGCWLCETVCVLYGKALDHRDSPPYVDHPSDLHGLNLLMWFATLTNTKTGYLDQFKNTCKISSILSLSIMTFHTVTDITSLL
jgi:hypothetical protein